MKKKPLIFLLFFLFNHAFAASFVDVPDEFYVTQHWISNTSSFDVETKDKKMGALYRRWFSILLSYDFYDSADDLIATATARFFSIGAHFDIYDDEKHLLGMVEELIFTLLPSFEIHSSESIKLATAEMNVWGTEFMIYDAITHEEIALMSRPFFRLKNDWTISIINKALLTAKNIDVRLFMTVIAFQGDTEEWGKYKNMLGSTLSPNIIHVQHIKNQLKHLSKEQHLDDMALPDTAYLEEIAKKTSKNVQTNLNMTDEERFNDFIQYCFSQVQAAHVPPIEKKAILYLLKKRLMSM
jgi:hypothetical protein